MLVRLHFLFSHCKKKKKSLCLYLENVKIPLRVIFSIFSKFSGRYLAGRLSIGPNVCNMKENGLKKPLCNVQMMNLNKPKNDNAWNYRLMDLKPLQSYTEYVPVYGDKSKSPTAIGDEKWQILGKKRMDDYLSHRQVNDPNQCNELLSQGGWQSMEQNHSTFDNCYILGEPKLSACLPSHMEMPNKSNRHSFCEYKPFSARKTQLAKLKFFTPMDYKPPNHHHHAMSGNPANLMGIPMENRTSAEDGQFNLLPLIGESRVAAYQNVPCNLMKPLTPYPSPNEFDDMSIGPFCGTQKITNDIGVECKCIYI